MMVIIHHNLRLYGFSSLCAEITIRWGIINNSQMHTVVHSVTLIHIAHMMVIIQHKLRLYGFSSTIAEITFSWGIMNISQHA